MSFSVPNSVDPKSRASIWLESQRLNLSVVCDGVLCGADCLTAPRSVSTVPEIAVASLFVGSLCLSHRNNARWHCRCDVPIEQYTPMAAVVSRRNQRLTLLRVMAMRRMP